MAVILCSFNLFSQDIDEKKLNVVSLDEAFLKKLPMGGNVDCKCNNSILKDWSFQSLSASGSNITSSSTPWLKGANTPQWTPAMGACDKGYVSMWGNKTVGESIHQNLSSPLVSGKTYKIKFSARFINPSSSPSTFVRLKVIAGNTPPSYDGAGVVSTNISSTTWATYNTTANIVGSGQTYITLHPENDYTQNDGKYVSWIQIDNICIEEVCKISDEQCNPNFTASPFTLNSQCNVVVNVNPTVTAGATHYWGMMGATGLGDNTPIPLSSIISGASFGLSVSSTGVATPIGMGTGINASSSGYGFHYEGAAFGTCFKITHYIKCCSKWYFKTITYCTKLCPEVKETDLRELPSSEVEKIETQLSSGGRG